MKDYEEVFKKYSEIQDEIKKLELRQQKYKQLIYEILNTENTNKFSTVNYNIEKKIIKNERINKSDTPIEIWKKFAKQSTYQSLIVKKRYSDDI